MIHFIINPTSRSGEGKNFWELVKSELDSQKVSYDFHFTISRDETETFTRALMEIDEPLPHVLAVLGGDGTMNEVLNGITDRKNTQVIYMPIGTGNDLGRSMGVKSDPVAIAKRITALKELPQDIGEVICTAEDGSKKHRLFAISSGIGFDAYVCALANESGRKTFLNRLHLGKLAYVANAIKGLRLSPMPDAVLTEETNVRQIHGLTFVAAMNQRYEGGGFPFCPDNQADDGLLDICCCERITLKSFPSLMLKATKGKHVEDTKHVYVSRGTEFRVDSQEPLWVHTDGETPGKYKHVTFRIPKDGKLTFLV